MICEICPNVLINNQKRYCCHVCRNRGTSIFNKTNNIKPPNQTGKKWTEKQKDNLKKIRALTPSSMLNPKTVKKIEISKKITYDKRGRKSNIRNRIKRLEKYIKWRKDIFERDKYTCQVCKSTGGELQVDHIKPICLIIRENNISCYTQALKIKELWDTKNGRTLCKKCHKQTDTYGIGSIRLLKEKGYIN